MSGWHFSMLSLGAVVTGSTLERSAPPYSLTNEKTLTIGENPKGELFDISSVSQI